MKSWQKKFAKRKKKKNILQTLIEKRKKHHDGPGLRDCMQSMLATVRRERKNKKISAASSLLVNRVAVFCCAANRVTGPSTIVTSCSHMLCYDCAKKCFANATVSVMMCPICDSSLAPPCVCFLCRARLVFWRDAPREITRTRTRLRERAFARCALTLAPAFDRLAAAALCAR